MENKNIYYKINESDYQLTEQLLNENNIGFVKYNDILKAVCDEETERLRIEYLDIKLTDKQAEELSDCMFDTEMDLLNYDTFLEIADRFVDGVVKGKEVL